MSASGLLYGGIAALVLAVFALAVALMPKRQGKRGVTQALATIDRRYTRDIRTGAAGPAAAPTLSSCPAGCRIWQCGCRRPALAVPCSAGWTSRATQRAGRRTACWRSRHSVWSYSARSALCSRCGTRRCSS